MCFILICVGMFHIFLNIFDIFIYMFDMLIDISICLLICIYIYMFPASGLTAPPPLRLGPALLTLPSPLSPVEDRPWGAGLCFFSALWAPWSPLSLDFFVFSHSLVVFSSWHHFHSFPCFWMLRGPLQTLKTHENHCTFIKNQCFADF